MRLSLLAVIGLAGLLLGGCSSRSPIPLPPVGNIVRIEVWANSSYDPKTNRYNRYTDLRDATKTTKVMVFVQNRNRRMRAASTTYPTPTHTMVLHEGGRSSTLFIGKNWFGDGTRLASLDPEDRVRLLALLELPADARQ